MVFVMKSKNFSYKTQDIVYKKVTKVIPQIVITKGIYTSIKTKNRLFQTCYKYGDRNKLLLYKSYSNKLAHLKKISKRQYYNNLFNEHRDNKTETWKIISNLISKNKSHPNKIFQKQLQLAKKI